MHNTTLLWSFFVCQSRQSCGAVTTLQKLDLSWRALQCGVQRGETGSPHWKKQHSVSQCVKKAWTYRNIGVVSFKKKRLCVILSAPARLSTRLARLSHHAFCLRHDFQLAGTTYSNHWYVGPESISTIRYLVGIMDFQN